MTNQITALAIKARKQQLRAEVQAARNALPDDELQSRSAALIERALQLRALQEAQWIMAFASFRSEVRTAGLLRWAITSGKQLLLPRIIRGTRQLELYLVRDLEYDLAPGVWQIPEPISERCPRVELHVPDFIIIPGVAFDERGHRLGYGGGFYDNLLRVLSGRCWPEHMAAFALECQIVPEVPIRPRDFTVPHIVTEDRIISAL